MTFTSVTTTCVHNTLTSHWCTKHYIKQNVSCESVCDVFIWPSQILVSSLRAKPFGHSHWKLPKVLMQFPPWHNPGSSWHSLISDKQQNTQHVTLHLLHDIIFQSLCACSSTLQYDCDRIGSESFSSRTQNSVLRCRKPQEIVLQW